MTAWELSTCQHLPGRGGTGAPRAWQSHFQSPEYGEPKAGGGGKTSTSLLSSLSPVPPAGLTAWSQRAREPAMCSLDVPLQRMEQGLQWGGLQWGPTRTREKWESWKQKTRGYVWNPRDLGPPQPMVLKVGGFCPHPRGHLEISVHIFACHNWVRGLLLASRG